jgi:hypothetical protein
MASHPLVQYVTVYDVGDKPFEKTGNATRSDFCGVLDQAFKGELRCQYPPEPPKRRKGEPAPAPIPGGPPVPCIPFPPNCEYFCWPDGADLRQTPSFDPALPDFEIHSFAATDTTGRRVYGHCCLRYKPMEKQKMAVVRLQEGARQCMDESGSTKELPSELLVPFVICVISVHQHHQSICNALREFARALPRRAEMTPVQLEELYHALAVDISDGPAADAQQRLINIGGARVAVRAPDQHEWRAPRTRWVCKGCDETYLRAAEQHRCSMCGVCRRCAASALAAAAAPPASTPTATAAAAATAATVAVGGRRGGCSEALPVCDVDFQPLLTRLSASATVALFTALLCEQQLLFLCEEASPLFQVCEALMALLYPLEVGGTLTAS